MKLIDADEVRKRAVEVYQGNGVELETIMMVPLSAIDNAEIELFPLTVTLGDKVTDENLEVIKQLMRDYKPQVLNLEMEKQKSEWIPVSEKLPEIDVEVIVTDIQTEDAYCSWYQGNGFWQCDNGVFNNRIIAWQPLPEPYKKGGAE